MPASQVLAAEGPHLAGVTRRFDHDAATALASQRALFSFDVGVEMAGFGKIDYVRSMADNPHCDS